ncbi:hypothetical protein [uncultured Lamprocystis sp.]|uniref:hypothetical protein n=1 Tax=uncultured Lamprocystis sp. TaxID=543132 RepID=UPI0025FF6A74|nr:hypothetical protein [uncultured Lamprocystis sp.]
MTGHNAGATDAAKAQTVAILRAHPSGLRSDQVRSRLTIAEPWWPTEQRRVEISLPVERIPLELLANIARCGNSAEVFLGLPRADDPRRQSPRGLRPPGLHLRVSSGDDRRGAQAHGA